MKKLAIAFSSKDRVELSMQTVKPLLQPDKFDLWWIDGSKTLEGQELPEQYNHGMHVLGGITGGPDRCIVYALTEMLKHDYKYVGLCENDVLLDDDWYQSTFDLFKYSVTEGIPIGAVTARSFADRVLIQRDGYCVLHNAGAGFIIFTRQAAQIILQNYRTGWWPENRATFSQLSGIDIGKFGAFGFNDQMITADWSWDAILAVHGLATVALTPSKATMIGQDIAEQGLQIVTDDPLIQTGSADDRAFDRFRRNLIDIHAGKLSLPTVDHNLRTRNGTMMFPHHAVRHGAAWQGKWKSKWSQGFGPFAYVAAEQATFQIPVFGSCAFTVSGGRIILKDEATGFSHGVDLTDVPEAVTIPVPRDMQTGIIRLEFGEGACLHGIETLHPQAEWSGTPFDYSTLPETA